VQASNALVTPLKRFKRHVHLYSARSSWDELPVSLISKIGNQHEVHRQNDADLQGSHESVMGVMLQAFHERNANLIYMHRLNEDNRLNVNEYPRIGLTR